MKTPLPPAVILAGSLAQRPEGGEHTMLPLGKTVMLEQLIAALRPQSSAILLNSNSAPSLFSGTGLEIRPDALPGQPGPLAGIHTAMLWAQARGGGPVLTVPAAISVLPPGLTASLMAAHAGGHIAIAACAGVLHPALGLWPSALAGVLQHEMKRGLHSVRAWLELLPFKTVDFESAIFRPFSSYQSGIGETYGHCEPHA